MTDQSKEMAKIAVHALGEKKAEDIQIIDIREISVIADYFVIASASNSNQIQAMMDAVEEELYKEGYHCAQKEGNQNSSWDVGYGSHRLPRRRAGGRAVWRFGVCDRNRSCRFNVSGSGCPQRGVPPVCGRFQNKMCGSSKGIRRYGHH